MSLFLSLQGSMAAGKTTVARYLEACLPEIPLQKELEQVKGCLPHRILFLDASEEWLRKNKEGDETRSREFFEYYVKHLMPLKRKWFSGRPDVDFLKTDGMTVEEMGHAVKEWVEEQGKR